MRRFNQLNKKEKKAALVQAEVEAIKLIAVGKVSVPDSVSSKVYSIKSELCEFVGPLALEIAENAFYPEADDIVINL